MCRQRVTFDPTSLPRTISPSSILYSSPCLINVIPVCLSINLYEPGAQWLSKTNQSCWTAPLLNSRSLAELEETEKYGLGGREEGCLCPFFFFFFTDAGECSSSNSGVSSGKNIRSIMEWGWACHHYQWEEEACQSTQRGKRHNPRQRRTGGMEGRREGERETTHEELREGQREGLKSIPIRDGGDSRCKELKRALMRDLDKPPQTCWQIEWDREKIASQREEDKERKTKNKQERAEKRHRPKRN